MEGKQESRQINPDMIAQALGKNQLQIMALVQENTELKAKVAEQASLIQAFENGQVLNMKENNNKDTPTLFKNISESQLNKKGGVV